jgi:hypothetical protein
MNDPENYLKSIHPRKHPKYSKNLFAWLSHCAPAELAMIEVYVDASSILWVGYIDDGFLVGQKLMLILCQGEKVERMAYPLIRFPAISLRDGFWEEYLSDGRCAIDRDHRMTFIDDQTRWVKLIMNRRKCLWCRKVVQQKVTKTRLVMEEVWENDCVSTLSRQRKAYDCRSGWLDSTCRTCRSLPHRGRPSKKGER